MPKNSKRKPLSKNQMLALVVAGVGAVCVLALAVSFFAGGRDEPLEPQPPVSSSQKTQGTTEGPDLGDDCEMPPKPDNTEPIEDFEDTSHGYEENGNCINDKVLTYVYNDAGDSISVGASLQSRANTIYLNPSASIATPEKPVGFYISTDRVPPLYAQEDWKELSEMVDLQESNFIIKLAHDQLKPASYRDDKNFGISWTNDYLEDGMMDTGCTVYLRAVSLRGGKLLATLKATIEFNTDTSTYELTALDNADVSATGELTEEQRTGLLEAAFALAENDYYGSQEPEVTMDEHDEAIAGGFVQKVDSGYFNKAINMKREVVYSQRLIINSHIEDLYAVSFPCREGSYMTYYFSPQAKPPVPWAHSAEAYLEENVVDLTVYTDMNPLMYDYYYPYNRTIRPGPGGYFD